jgi:Tfp pilus assembly protein PilF
MKGTAFQAMQAIKEPQTQSKPTALELLTEYLQKPAVLLFSLGLVTLHAAVTTDVWAYHYWLGRALEQGGDSSGARTQYQQALELNPASTESKERLAFLQTK